MMFVAVSDGGLVVILDEDQRKRNPRSHKGHGVLMHGSLKYKHVGVCPSSCAALIFPLHYAVLLNAECLIDGPLVVDE